MEKGLTQASLAGDKITRNMLSLIETGASCPSVDTLEYLAQRLDVPVGYFFTNTPEEEKSYRKSVVMGELKRAYSAGDYGLCTELCGTLPSAYADDEIHMIGALSYIKTAVVYAEQYGMSRAALCLSKATEHSNKTIYLDDSFFRAVAYYRELFRCLNTEDIPALLTDLNYASPLVPSDMILYFGILKLSRETPTSNIPFLTGTVYEKHIQAVLFMHEDNYGKALTQLKLLTRDTALPYFMRYKVFCDLESAAEKTGDLRSAYVAARKKLELLKSDKT